MKRHVLAMALALALVGGSFLGSLPGKDAMTVQAAEAGVRDVSGGNAETLDAPTNLRWADGTKILEEGDVLTSQSYCFMDGYTSEYGVTGVVTYEVEFYVNGEYYKKVSRAWLCPIGPSLSFSNTYTTPGGWKLDSKTGELSRCNGDKKEGIWTFRARAVSADGKSYGEWSEFSRGLDTTKETFLASRGLSSGSNGTPGTSSSNGSAPGTSSSNGSSVDTSADADDNGDGTGSGTVTTSSGEALASSAAVNVTGSTPAVVRTPQSAVTAAAASAVGGLKEGQYVVATVGDSACGELARQAVTNAASSVNGRVAAYLEITLDVCNQGGGLDQHVTQLSTPIEFAVAAPADIDGSRYDFAVVRLHGDGQADILRDLDNDPATITFRTDRFSVYAVIYGPKGAFGGSGKDSVPRTGDGAIPALPFAAAGAVCAAAFALGKKERQ